jgi:putative Holliday junction resolvase
VVEGERGDDVVLGVDYGTVRVGLALGFLDTGLTIALPVLANPGTEEALVASLAEVARARDATVVVLGNPLHMSGKKSAGTHTVTRLRDRLHEATKLPVVLEDERLTSADAESQLKDAGLRWWQVPKGQIDTVSAMGIVRGYMTRRRPELLVARDEPVAPVEEEEKDETRARRERRKKAQRRKRGE